MEEDDKNQCVKLTQELLKHKDSAPFREPVPWKEWALLDYPRIIKKPMDLGTVLENLEKGEYKTLHEYACDIRLIWKLNNKEGSDYYNFAKKMQVYFEQRYKKIDTSLDTQEPTADEKTSFSEDLYKIAGIELGKVVTMIYEKCKDSVTKVNNVEIDINVDKIDPDTLRCIEAYVKSCISNVPEKRKVEEEVDEESKKIKIEEKSDVEEIIDDEKVTKIEELGNINPIENNVVETNN